LTHRKATHALSKHIHKNKLYIPYIGSRKVLVRTAHQARPEEDVLGAIEIGLQNENQIKTEWSDSIELAKNEEIIRRAAVLSAAALWISRHRMEARKHPASRSFEEEYRAICEENDNCPTEPLEPHPGCSVGVYLVRSDGYSCQREQVQKGIFRHKHPSTQQLLIMWESPPEIVFLMKKLGQTLLPQLIEVAKILHTEGTKILVEETVYVEMQQAESRDPSLSGVMESVKVWDSSYNVDLITCLGGDGVILHASSLFQGPCPPLLGFNLGSMGFLAPHTFTCMRTSLREAMMLSEPTEETKAERGKFLSCDGIPITLRMRIHCELWSNGAKIPGSKEFEVLNELCMDRGPSSFLSMIECYELTRDDELRLLTKVQADGLIVSTATGSTAYSVSAGGSMVHPSVPSILVTPICPHSLSFRPLVLPDSARLLLRVPEDARSAAWVCFDGKSRQEIKRGDGIYICMSQYPVATVNWGDQMSEFVGSLVRCLNWNDREEQKPLEEVSSISKNMFV